MTSHQVQAWIEKKYKARDLFKDAVLFMYPYMKMYMKIADAEQMVREFLEAGHASTEAGSNDMTVRNYIKKKTMAEL